MLDEGCGGSSMHMSNRVRVDVAVKGCNASKTHVLLQLGYAAYTGNRRIWVMTSYEITWHWKRSIHIECSSKWPTVSSRNHTVWIIQVLTLFIRNQWKKMQLFDRMHRSEWAQWTWVRHVWQWLTEFPLLSLNEHDSVLAVRFVMVWSVMINRTRRFHFDI